MSSCGWCSTTRTDPFCSKSAKDVYHVDGVVPLVQARCARALIPATGDTNTRPVQMHNLGATLD